MPRPKGGPGFTEAKTTVAGPSLEESCPDVLTADVDPGEKCVVFC